MALIKKLRKAVILSFRSFLYSSQIGLNVARLAFSDSILFTWFSNWWLIESSFVNPFSGSLLGLCCVSFLKFGF